jgi:LAS superfamily LD-carboxypeptidase LdcB
MGDNIRSYTIVVFIFLAVQIVFAQESYNKFELTGRQKYDSINEYKNLQKEAYQAFVKMQEAAQKEGVFIEIASGYRSFNRQKFIWNNKYTRYIQMGLTPKEAVQKIIEYSTIPGTSRHHWGTDIDIYDLNAEKTENILIEENYNKGGVYEKLKIWMDQNSKKFGFTLVYTNKEDRKGFKYEPWHYSYYKISKPMLNDFLKQDIISFLNSQDIMGKDVLTTDFIDKYISENILDINSLLR